MKSGIYMWTSPSGKSYIGQSVDLVDRHREFVRFDQRYAGHRINNARKKYNHESDWKYEVLEYCDYSKLNEREIYYIELYDTYRNGYNQCLGGSATFGYKFTDEQKKRMSIVHTGRKQSEEEKQKKREKESGVNNPFYGKTHDYETRKKMSKPIIQYTLEGEFVREWIGAMEVKHILGYNQGCITACCRGNQNTAYGFKWAYKNPPPQLRDEG